MFIDNIKSDRDRGVIISTLRPDLQTVICDLADEDPPDVCVIPVVLSEHLSITVAGTAGAYGEN